MWQTVKHIVIETTPGVVKMVAIAVVLGLAFNAMNVHGLPLIRRPLRETRDFAEKASLVQFGPNNQPKVDKRPSNEPKSTVGITLSKPAAPKAQNLVHAHKGMTSNAETVTKKSHEQSEKAAQALFTTLQDAKVMFDKKSAIFIDARPREDYEAEHITGAISLFVDDTGRLYEKALGKISKDMVIVTYCSDPECEGAAKLADMLVAKGHIRVVILLDGLPGWEDAGYPTESGAASK